MLASEKIAELQARKQLLVAESDLHRQMLAVHWASLGTPVRQAQAGWRTLMEYRSYLLWVAPLFGFMLARGNRADDGWFPRTRFLWRWGGRLLQAWRFWQSLNRK
jgi:hypothetical protein